MDLLDQSLNPKLPEASDLSGLHNRIDTGQTADNVEFFWIVTQASPVANTWYTMVEVASGSGYIDRLGYSIASTLSGTVEIKLTIDGVVVLTDSYTVTGTVNNLMYGVAIGSKVLALNSGSFHIAPVRIPYRESFKFEMRQTAGVVSDLYTFWNVIYTDK